MSRGHWFPRPSFCGNCGSDQLLLVPSETALRCDACSETTYIASKPAVCGIVISDGGRDLLLVRTQATGDAWDLPGGYLLYGESPQSGLCREMQEELGVDVEVGRLVDAIVDAYQGNPGHCLNLFYLVTLVTSDIRHGPEIVESGWHALETLPALAYPSTEAALVRLWNEGKRGKGAER